MGGGKGGLWSNTRGSGCFVAGTLILTEHGHRPIEEIRVGDYVWSENVLTGEKGLKRVINTFVHDKETLINLCAGDIVIQTTEEHPFWAEGKGWTFAGNLEKTDLLRSSSKQLHGISNIAKVSLQESVKVYNFEVDEWHVYCVSELGVVVHNKAQRAYKKKISVKKTGGKAKDDIPSWAKGEKPYVGESGKDFAKRIMDEKYGSGNYKTGPGSEYSELRKYGDTHFK